MSDDESHPEQEPPAEGPGGLAQDLRYSAVLGALGAATAAKFVDFMASGSKELVTELRKQPFLYNVFHSGLFGAYQVLGLRITNPHPDTIYIGNFTIEKSVAPLRLACVMTANFAAGGFDPLVGGSIGLRFEAQHSSLGPDDKLGPKALGLDLRDVLDRAGLAIPPLDRQDLALFFERPGGAVAFEGGRLVLRLACESQRADVSNNRIEAFARNKPI